MKEKKVIDRLTKLRFEHNKQVVEEQIKKESIDRPENHKGSFVTFRNIQKVYPNGYHAVNNFNLDIQKGEFIVLVGPSGCGKTTTLRMVCGLEDITAGALYINDVFANHLEPKERGLSMVFQNYALFPHLTVYDNLAYGLKIKKIYSPLYDKQGNQLEGIDQKKIKALQKELRWYLKNDPTNEEIENVKHDIELLSNTPVKLFGYRKLTKVEIDKKIQKAAEILNLSELLTRKPGQLSGGQCQRVALGRVIVSDAKLLLMDEPLSNLDAKLRVSMRGEITKLHKTLNATTIYVTHDQVEAMTMADRIVIMDRTLIKQIGTPSEVYEHPNCLFVATFIGSPTMNIVDAKLEKDSVLLENIALIKEKGISSKVSEFYKNLLAEYNEEFNNLSSIYKNEELLEAEKTNLQNKIDRILDAQKSGDYPLKFGVRPESLILGDKGTKFEGTILSSELLGDEYHVNVRVGNETVLVKLPNTFKCEIGAKVTLEVEKDKYHLFDALSERTIF